MHTVSRLFGPTTKIKDIKGQAKVKQRTEKTRKHCHCCHGLLTFVKTLFTLNDWFPHASSCYVRSRVTRIITGIPVVAQS